MFIPFVSWLGHYCHKTYIYNSESKSPLIDNCRHFVCTHLATLITLACSLFVSTSTGVHFVVITRIACISFSVSKIGVDCFIGSGVLTYLSHDKHFYTRIEIRTPRKIHDASVSCYPLREVELHILSETKNQANDVSL